MNIANRAERIDGFQAAAIRIARPTDRLQEVVRFYRDGLGLPVIGSFRGHAGYDGVMLGMPDKRCHLEFTHHVEGSPCPAPTRDNLLVFYFADDAQLQKCRGHLETMGYGCVQPENPYWLDISWTFEDPDGWRVVLAGDYSVGTA
ncbi:MAG: VOC family protein [Candidatus Eremiobacteraeota bacterium]|nr:VOC family protein [Candidatus Eremiobacteraeota bacterium]